MTVEVFTPAPTYTVSGIGPYAIGHPYVADSIRALVTVSGVEMALAPGDITVTPAAAAVSGSLFLSPAAAATHAGRVLRIERMTVAEQGWVGVQGEREKGLETQLDRTTYSLQELVAIISRSLRTRDALPAFVPQAGRTLVYDGTAIVAGPLASDIEAAVGQAAVFRGTWVTGAVYAFREQVFEPVSGNGYQCLIAHTAGTFSTDLAAGRWAIYVQRGASGGGSGDMVASQNLNDLLDKNAARVILGVNLPNLGVTASAAELNILDGVTATTAELNILGGVTATAAELNILDGVIKTAADINALHNVTDRIINGAFDVWQRGTSSTSSGYAACDRWPNSHIGGTVTQSRQTFAAGTTFGANNPAFFLRQSVSGQSLASHFAIAEQRIEDVRTYAGQTITVLGWAKRGSGTGNMAVEGVQFFGTGGSPSATVTGIGAAQVALTGSWAPFAVTMSVPSVTGKTGGTDGNSYFNVILWASGGSDFNARNASLGIQTIGIDYWGVHIRLGTHAATAAADYVAPPVGDTLRACQRYFAQGTTGGPTNNEGLFNLGALATGPFAAFPVTMRTAPTMTFADVAGNASRFSDIAGTVHNQVVSGGSPVAYPTIHGFIPDFGAIASGLNRWRINWTASAEL